MAGSAVAQIPGARPASPDAQVNPGARTRRTHQPDAHGQPADALGQEPSLLYQCGRADVSCDRPPSGAMKIGNWPGPAVSSDADNCHRQHRKPGHRIDGLARTQRPNRRQFDGRVPAPPPHDPAPRWIDSSGQREINQGMPKPRRVAEQPGNALGRYPVDGCESQREREQNACLHPQKESVIRRSCDPIRTLLSHRDPSPARSPEFCYLRPGGPARGS